MQDEKLLLEFKDYIRTQRHWMLNQFQVIMGYIQLGKPNMAFEYIKRATAEVEGTNVFTQVPDTELGVKACLLWWKFQESNISLFPIIDKNITLRDKALVFTELEKIMDDLRVRYFEYLINKHVTWKINQEENKIISSFKCDDDTEFPNLYTENIPFLGKVNIDKNVIVFIIEN